MKNKFEELNEKEDLKEKIRLTMQNAISLEEAEKRTNEEDSLLSSFINKQISLREYKEKEAEHNLLQEAGVIKVSSLSEMYNAIYATIGNEEIARELVEHERSHCKEIEALGFGFELLLRFFKNENNIISFRPSISVDIPEDGNEDQIREKLKIIIGAPIYISDSDERKLSSADSA